MIATSRRSSSEAQLRAAGADHVMVEPNIREQVRARHPDGVARALECIGEPTLDPTPFTLEQYDDAMAFLDSKERRGKVVVTVE